MANGILHFRVDDRMIHGIVATDWVPAYNATRAMVIDGPASTNDIVRSGLKMACPAGVALSVLAPEKAVENIKAGKYSAQRVFVVFRYFFPWKTDSAFRKSFVQATCIWHRSAHYL